MKVKVQDVEAAFTKYEDIKIMNKKYPNRKLRYFVRLRNGLEKEIDSKTHQIVLRCVCGMYIDGEFEI